MIPRKFTSCITAVDKCDAGLDAILLGTPPRPLSRRSLSDHPAQYPAAIPISWIYISPLPPSIWHRDLISGSYIFSHHILVIASDSARIAAPMVPPAVEAFWFFMISIA